jgi:glycosyltransferase involved in cell wall biosynthesis
MSTEPRTARELAKRIRSLLLRALMHVLFRMGVSDRILPFKCAEWIKNRILLSLFRANTVGSQTLRVSGQKSGLGVNLFGMLEAPTGMGESARSSARALAAAGVPVFPMKFVSSDIYGGIPPFRRGTAMPYPTNLCHINPPQTGYFMRRFGPDTFSGRFNIGYWVWELERFPPHWDIFFNYYHEIWTPSAFAQRAIAARTSMGVVRVPHCIDIPVQDTIKRSTFGLPEDRTCFLCMFDMGSLPERKNPLGAIKAFRKGCGDNPAALLVVKISYAARNPRARGEIREALQGLEAVVIEREMSREESWGLIGACDALISLHRTEGFGLILAEAMALGKPVVATDYSGNTDFMNTGNSYPVGYRLVTIEKETGPFPAGSSWAEPDIEHAAAQIKAILKDPEGAKEMGRKGAVEIASRFSPRVVGELMRARLQALGN